MNYLQVYRIWVEPIQNLLIINLKTRAFTSKPELFISATKLKQIQYLCIGNLPSVSLKNFQQLNSSRTA
jgi:hypothetical protein